MTATMTFTCSICGEGSTRICARCTKDACDNHLCEKCLRCSDCCECEVALDEAARPVVKPFAIRVAPPPPVPESGAVPPPLAEVPAEPAERETEELRASETEVLRASEAAEPAVPETEEPRAPETELPS